MSLDMKVVKVENDGETESGNRGMSECGSRWKMEVDGGRTAGGGRFKPNSLRKKSYDRRGTLRMLNEAMADLLIN